MLRFAISLLLAFTVVAPVACSGGDDEAAAVPLSQRFVTAEDAPGTTPDPVEEGETAADLDEFIATSSERFIDPDTEEMNTVFQEAGFTGAGVDVRFFGEKHNGHAPHVFSSFIELESEDGASSALDWLVTDSKKPCPESCAVQISTFDVDDVADGRGVHRIATAEDIERVGTPEQVPFESYWVGFTDGAFTYSVDLFGRPGSVSEEQALDIASAYHDRLAGG